MWLELKGSKCDLNALSLQLYIYQFISTSYILVSVYFSSIDGSAISVCKGILNQLGIEGATDDVCVTVRCVCEAVSTRAARLAVTGIYTILQKIGKLDKCTVAIDGTLYEKHPYFRDRFVVDHFDDVLPYGNVLRKE